MVPMSDDDVPSSVDNCACNPMTTMEAGMPRAASAAAVLGRMRREHLDLYCEHDRRRGRIVWHLTDGTEVPTKLAHELVRHPNIKPAGDVPPFGKGARLPCQT